MTHILGLHPLDAAIVILSLVAVLVIGYWVSRKVHGEDEFFVGGRSMGAWLQFFINFGQATDSNGAPTIATEVSRQGVGGMWIGFQTLFCTPFVWFSSIWFRRTRLVTGADVFLARFKSKRLATMFAMYMAFTIPLSLAMGNIISYKVAAAMLVKPEASWTVEERTSVEMFREYSDLKKLNDTNALPTDKKARYQELNNLAQKDQLQSQISYISEVPFYLAYTGFVAFYIMLGGIRAAAITDAVQGLLIIVFSLVMIPIGLAQVGGFKGLHEKVPSHFFDLFGGTGLGDYTWYSIAAIVFTSLLSYANPGSMGNTAAAGATNETAIRVGQLSGLFLKRFIMIAWMMCGLLAVALIPGGASDADATWGLLAGKLLGPGLMGLMISGMLLGHMPAVGVSAVGFSATVTRNIYEPLFPGRSPAHYLVIAKSGIALALGLGVVFSMFFTGVISLLSAIITFGAFFGCVGFLIYFWRKLTGKAVAIGCVVWVLMMAVVAWGLPKNESLRRTPSLMVTTESYIQKDSATMADVAAKRAAKVGDPIERKIDSRPIYFERIARIDPRNPDSAMEGLGRFHIENWILHKLGLPLERCTPGGLVATRWLFDGVFPMAMLIILSLLTLPRVPNAEDELRIARFYARLKTPIAATNELDDQELAKTEADPKRFDHLKLFPRSAWEFTVWERSDWLGFLGCWGGVLGILAILWGILQVG